MIRNWHNKTHEAWVNEIANNGYDTVGVLKFDNGRYIKPKQALALYKAYWHKVDRTLFGCAANKGYGVQRWCFSELGADERNLHLHFVAVSPFATEAFCAVLNGFWSNFHPRTAHSSYNWITPIQHRFKAAAYTAKSTKQFQYDQIGIANCFQPSATLKHYTFDPAAQARRITNRLTDEQFEQAFTELNRQIAETVKRHEQRQSSR